MYQTLFGGGSGNKAMLRQLIVNASSKSIVDTLSKMYFWCSSVWQCMNYLCPNLVMNSAWYIAPALWLTSHFSLCIAWHAPCFTEAFLIVRGWPLRNTRPHELANFLTWTWSPQLGQGLNRGNTVSCQPWKWYCSHKVMDWSKQRHKVTHRSELETSPRYQRPPFIDCT